MILQCYSWAYIQTKLSFKKIHPPPISIAALFTTAKAWKQRQYPLTDKRVTHTQTHTDQGTLLSPEKE